MTFSETGRSSQFQRLHLSSTVQTLRTLSSLDHKAASRPYTPMALHIYSSVLPFSFEVEDPEIVIRSAEGSESYGQNPVLCKAKYKHHARAQSAFTTESAELILP